LAKFRASGKKILAYGMDWSKREYYLSSVADNIILNPVGMMEINGLSSQPMFLAGAFQKYGIGVQVVRVGKFKGAVEPLILDKLSPENRQQTQKLLDDVWQEWRQTVGNSRHVSPDKLQAIADSQGVLDATEAQANGLIDQVAYTDEVVTRLKQLTGSSQEDKTFTKISLSDYAQVPGKSNKSAKKVAIVYAEGEIVDGKGDENEIGGDRFAKIFSKLRQDSGVKAIVLRINSPGGSATGAEVMQREIKLTRQVKPVVVSMGDVAASGGYWIASDSNRIFAEPNTITGSIGVFGVLFNGQKLGNNNGITWDVVKTAKYADTQTVSRPRSPQELALYQRSVDRIYSMFLGKVAQGRNLTTQKVAEIAQGRVWSGTAAKEIGLVDEIGGLNLAVAFAAKSAKLGNDWELQEYPRVSSFEERLFGRIVEESRANLGIARNYQTLSHPLTDELAKLQQEIQVFSKMNDPQGIYARLPFNLQLKN
jgi:protease-4